MYTQSTFWTPERKEDLALMWNEGIETRIIGKALGATKNAVIGKAHRMRLTPRPSPIVRNAPKLSFPDNLRDRKFDKIIAGQTYAGK